MRAPLCFVKAFAFADQCQRQVRQRRKIAARSHASLRWNHRSHAAIEHLAEGVDDDGAHAGVAFRQRVGAQQHHGARVGERKRFADADGVRAHQVDLQLADLIADDVHIAQLAHARRDRVGNFVVGHERVDDGAGAVDGLARVGIEQYGPFFGGDFTHRLESQIVSVNVQSFQE